jgi:cyclophilin family peptidyl-prolyl cis-trans isomerase
MSFLKRLSLATILLAAMILPASAAEYLKMDLKYGQVVIELRPDLAPKHVARIKELADSGFYDGIIFHRVIAGFMAQTGDPTGTGRGGSGQKLNAEFTRTPFKRGTVGMARAQSINSADSQFFICFTSVPTLDGQYTVWGQVVKGMEFVDKIQKGEPPRNPDRILKMRVSQTID